MKNTEAFVDKVLKLLNPGLPYGKMHPQRLKLIEVVEEREKQFIEKIEKAYKAGQQEQKRRDEVHLKAVSPTHPTSEISD